MGLSIFKWRIGCGHMASTELSGKWQIFLLFFVKLERSETENFIVALSNGPLASFNAKWDLSILGVDITKEQCCLIQRKKPLNIASQGQFCYLKRQTRRQDFIVFSIIELYWAHNTNTAGCQYFTSIVLTKV